MDKYKNLKIGDTSENGQIIIIDEDRLCYLVKSSSRGAYGIRTISKSLLSEYVSYFAKNQNASANDARDALSGNSDIDKFEYGYSSTLKVMAQMVLGKIEITTTKDLSIINSIIEHPLQQIFYGAPGTGKSHTINEITEQQPKENVFRTTFHPDSDYSTFVGCYKPCMINKEPLYKVGELINKLSEIKNSGVTYPCHKFAAKYWESLKDLSTEDIKKILTSCSFTESMNVEISKGVAIGEDLAKKTDNHKIVYSFVPQAFTKAYLRAWQTTDPVYLVIEEINRGNCAQIFGDLFQLLDRKNGVSEYPIKPDDDLGRFIAENLTNPVEGIPDEIRVGKELSLPANLYIWATMNTSDQSLFPIDSAFKRRWEWKYIPINTQKENWSIAVNGTNYDWSDFLEKINARIESATSSEDKMLGFYFCKAENNIIGADRFVSKVLFYLWNDVFKDYGFDDAIFNDEKGQKLSFRNFYKLDGTVDENKVKRFLDNLQVKGENDGPNGEDENSENAPGVTEKQLRFWQGFNNARKNNQEYCQIYTEKAPLGQQSMDLSFGTSAYRPFMSVLFNKSLIRAGIWIQGTDRSSEIFEHFKENEAAINEIAGVNMDFVPPTNPKNPDKMSYSVRTEKDINVNDESTWEEAYSWMMDMAIKMKAIKDKYGN